MEEKTLVAAEFFRHGRLAVALAASNAVEFHGLFLRGSDEQGVALNGVGATQTSIGKLCFVASPQGRFNSVPYGTINAVG